MQNKRGKSRNLKIESTVSHVLFHARCNRKFDIMMCYHNFVTTIEEIEKAIGCLLKRSKLIDGVYRFQPIYYRMLVMLSFSIVGFPCMMSDLHDH